MAVDVMEHTVVRDETERLTHNSASPNLIFRAKAESLSL